MIEAEIYLQAPNRVGIFIPLISALRVPLLQSTFSPILFSGLEDAKQ